MCALGIPGTSGAAGRSPMSPSETSLGDSPSNAPSSPTSRTPTSSEPSSPVPPTGNWYASSVARPPRAPASCSTSPPTFPQAKRQLVPFSLTAQPRGNRRPRLPRPQAPTTPKEEEGSQTEAGSVGRQPSHRGRSQEPKVGSCWPWSLRRDVEEAVPLSQGTDQAHP